MKERFEELLAQLLDGVAGPEGQEEMARLMDEHPELKKSVRWHLLMDQLLAMELDADRSEDGFVQALNLRAQYSKDGDEFTEAVTDQLDGKETDTPPLGLPPVTGGRTRRSRFQFWWRIGSVAAVALLAMFLLRMLEPAPAIEPVAWLGDISPGVEVVRKKQVLPSADEIEIINGDIIRTDEEQMAVLSFDDEPTSIEINPQSFVRVNVKSTGKRLFVGQGDILCDIAPQPAGKPMIIETPSARLEILGTRLHVEVGTADRKKPLASTRLAVEEGQVRLVRKADSEAIIVSSGQYTVADGIGDLRIMPLRAADPEWVNLIPGTMLADTGWALAAPGPTTGNYLMREGNSLVVKPRGVQVRIQKAVPFREGEIEFSFEMTGPYWEFRIKEQSERIHYGDIGVNGKFRGQHTVHLKVEGGNITAIIDGRDKTAFPDSVEFTPLPGPLSTDAFLRFTIQPRTYLKIVSMRMKVEKGGP